MVLGPHPRQADVFGACRPALASWERNPRATTSVLVGLARRGLWDTALKVTRFMEHCGLEVNCFHFTSVISACEKKGKWEMALTVLGRMKEEEILPSEVTYNAAISACAKGDAWPAALQLLEELRMDGCMPDSITYNAASSACAAAGLWNLSLILLQDMYESTVPANSITFSTLLSACNNAKQWQRAISILFGMPAQTCMPDKICYTAVISACEKAGEWNKALGCFSHMDVHTVEKDEICFNSAISACVRARSWSQALRLALEMEAVPIAVNGILWGGVSTAMQQSSQSVALLSSRLCREWASQQRTSHTSLDFVASRLGADESEHEVQVLCQANGVLAAFKPTGLSSEAALQRLSHLLSLQGYKGQLSRASRLDGTEPIQAILASCSDCVLFYFYLGMTLSQGATSGVMPVALGEPGSPAANWLNYQFAARMVTWHGCQGFQLTAEKIEWQGLNQDISRPVESVEGPSTAASCPLHAVTYVDSRCFKCHPVDSLEGIQGVCLPLCGFATGLARHTRPKGSAV